MEDFEALSNILLFIAGGSGFLVIGLLLGRLLRPKRPDIEKNTIYECGEEAVGSAWGQFNVKFYLVGLVFILLEVELAFIFPWAVVFGNSALQAQSGGYWGWFALAEMLLFATILVLGLVYAWRKGFLDWQAPYVASARTSKKPDGLPQTLYDDL